MNILREFSGMGTRPYPLDRERRRRVMIALAEKDLTITALAMALSLPRSYVSEISSGRDLSIKTETRIAEYLGKPADYLFPKRTFEEIGQMRQAEAEEKERGKAA
jgi:transcriptional regulator with XRE-family HTH domain